MRNNQKFRDDLSSVRRMELKSKSTFTGGFYEEMGPVFLGGNNRIPDPHFNRISLLESDAFDRRLLAQCAARIGEGIPTFFDALHPVPQALRELLKKEGFLSTGELRASMMLDEPRAPYAPVAGLDIQLVQEDTLDMFLELFLRGFSTPEEVIPFAKSLFIELAPQRSETVRMYLGTFKGEPACTEYLFYERDEGGINMVSTKESLRGRRLASAMVRCLMDDAHTLGVRRLSLEARANSAPERLYQRLGFVTLATHEVFTNTPDLRYGL